ncbi:hypothetical protein HK102_002592 [Quaeritorhiza haematococci]|nr:hypothetical protein HK102_002592 [Quaeritorhiza haematococci]
MESFQIQARWSLLPLLLLLLFAQEILGSFHNTYAGFQSTSASTKRKFNPRRTLHSRAASNKSLQARSSLPVPPVAKKFSTSTVVQGTAIPDEYAWLRNIKTDPDVQRYIDAENEYTNAMLEETKPLQKQIIDELGEWEGKLGEDETVPEYADDCGKLEPGISSFWEEGHYFYWIRYDENLIHPIYMRRKIHLSGAPQCRCRVPSGSSDEVVLDVNQIVPQTAPYLTMGVFEVNPHDETLLAYSIDLKGDEKYTLYFRNITTGVQLGPPQAISDTYYSARWSKGNWIYYNVVDPKWGVPRFVYRYCAVGCGQAPQSMSDAANESSGGANNSVGRSNGISERMQKAEFVRQPGEELVYFEDDISLTVEVSSTNDGSFLLIKASGQTTSEVLISRGATADDTIFKPLLTRVSNVQYDVEHRDGYFFIRSNARGAYNFFVAKVPAAMLMANDREPLSVNNIVPGGDVLSIIPHSPSRFVERIEVFVNHLVVWVWIGGSRQMMVVPLAIVDGGDGGASLPSQSYMVPFGGLDHLKDVYAVFPATLTAMESRLYRRYNTPCLSFSDSSFVRPLTYYNHDMNQRQTYRVGGQRLKDVDASAYKEERLWAPSYSPLNDAAETLETPVRVPISVVYKTDPDSVSSPGETAATGKAPLASPRPLLMIAYGAYGSFYDTTFSVEIFPLLERGFVYALCHPRGDKELGSPWYTEGKYEKKENTIWDVRDCMRYLVEAGYTERGQIAVIGRSAGGLVAGSVINNYGWVAGTSSTSATTRDTTVTDSNNSTNVAPANIVPTTIEDNYASVVIADVPFIDPILDMSDPSVPWVAFEYFEWGDPTKDINIFQTMLRYSPYHNIGREGGDMPSVMVIGGLADPRVPFWEPAKFAAKLREFKRNAPGRRVGERVLLRGGGGVVGTPLLLRITDEGHYASSTGGQRFQQLAERYAFIIEELDVALLARAR